MTRNRRDRRMIRTGIQRATIAFTVIVFALTLIVWAAGGLEDQPSQVGPAPQVEVNP